MFKYSKKELLDSVEGYKFPICSSKKYMMDKKFDYKIIMLLTLLSNKKTEEDICNSGDDELWRYIYRNKLANYEELVEELSKIKINSVWKSINKMIKIEDSLLKVRKTEDGKLIYDIDYRKNGREFVSIDTKIMKELINKFDSSSIKLYVLFCYMCAEKEKQMTQEWILKQVGLSVNNNNKQKITDITNNLAKCGLISKRTITSESKKRVTYYKTNSIKQWIDFNESKIDIATA